MQPEQVSRVDSSSIVQQSLKTAATSRSIDPFKEGAILEAAVVVYSGCCKTSVFGVLIRCSVGFGGKNLPHRGTITSPAYPFPSTVVMRGQKGLSYCTVRTANMHTMKDLRGFSMLASCCPQQRFESHCPSTP